MAAIFDIGAIKSALICKYKAKSEELLFTVKISNILQETKKPCHV
jgi:hypothetical protein